MDDVNVHRPSSLIKIDGLKVRRDDGATQVNFLSERTYIKFEAPELLDKRFVSPKTKLQGMRIELAAMPSKQRKRRPRSGKTNLQSLMVACNSINCNRIAMH